MGKSSINGPWWRFPSHGGFSIGKMKKITQHRPNKARFPQTFLAALADLGLPEVDAMRPAGVLETTRQLPAVWRRRSRGRKTGRAP